MVAERYVVYAADDNDCVPESGLRHAMETLTLTMEITVTALTRLSSMSGVQA